MNALAIDVRARRAWPWLPAVAQAGRVYQGPSGEVVRLREDGGAEFVMPGGYPHPGIAADPTARRSVA